MGGVVKKVVGGGSKPAPAPTPTPAPAAPTATRGQTDAALSRRAAINARRGSGRSLLSYSRTLGEQTALPGEDMR